MNGEDDDHVGPNALEFGVERQPLGRLSSKDVSLLPVRGAEPCRVPCDLLPRELAERRTRGNRIDPDLDQSPDGPMKYRSPPLSFDPQSGG